MNRLLRAACLLLFMTVICFSSGEQGFCSDICLDEDFSVSKKIYKTSLVALENIINVQDTVQSHIELLEGQEKELTEERQKLQLVAQDLQNMFPSGSNLDRTTKGFFKRLKDLDRDQAQRRLYKCYAEELEETKKISSQSIAVAAGLLAGVLGVAIGVLVWQGFGKSKDRCIEDYKAREAARWRSMSNYVRRELRS